MLPPISTLETAVRGSLKCMTQLLPFIGYPRTLNGLRAIDEVTAS